MNIKNTNWRTVISLSLTQSLFQTVSVLVMTLSGLVGLELASDKGLFTLPIAVIQSQSSEALYRSRLGQMFLAFRSLLLLFWIGL